MHKRVRVCVLAVLAASPAWAQAAAEPNCSYFGPQRESLGPPGKPGRLTRVTEQVSRARTAAFTPHAASDAAPSYAPGSIDDFLFGAMRAAGVTPAAKTSDQEFIRRVTLDLTGRIPAPDRVLQFTADSSPQKRAVLIDELLAKPEWTDKWTMYFGDLLKNTDFRPSTSLRRFPDGRNAFYQWIHDSLASGKPYNQMASELIVAQGSNSYTQGELNWILNGYITGGPAQDITDSQTANIAETFLGIAHVNCLLCHNGRGHLDALSLWGSRTTRYQAWQLASFLSHTTMARTPVDPANTNVYYWSALDSIKHDYQLGTTSGNRPPRAPIASCAAGKPCYVTPAYIFNGDTPGSGESYRAALAREVTGDVQFARAAVNYIWAQFFGRGIVDPPNQFDPARLDPDNPPAAPWTLQPSNARLLNALAQAFIQNQYSLPWLMRTIANSDAYQLSSRYDGGWDPSWEPLFARKFVRRLWAEEIHDAVVQSSGVLPAYKLAATGSISFPPIAYAMQLPDTVGLPGGSVTNFLDSFLRGNRDDADRKQEGSVLQALNLMNDSFTMSRTAASGASANRLLALDKTDEDLVNSLFLNVLSRYPSDAEKQTALQALKTGNRTQSARDLLWSLYNKVDFVFNY